MKDSILSKKYSNALCDGAKREEVANYISILSSYKDVLASKECRSKILNPFITKEDKMAFFKCDDVKVTRVVEMLAEINHLDILTNIYEDVSLAYNKLIKKFKGVIHSKDGVNKSDITEIEKRLSKYLDKEIELEYVKDDYNGVKVVVDDLFLEVSFSLNKIRDSLVSHVLKAV